MVNSTDFKNISSSDYKGGFAQTRLPSQRCVVLHAVISAGPPTCAS